ncbi:MAG: hypothetical protein IPM46_13845 [Flavobacteriales bacterium]|nr:hypothetical protein [Flavobacteriales bacterium]
MKKSLRRWGKRALLALVVIWLLLVLFAHRWFAISRTSGARDLVVEGWLYAGGCDTIAAWYRSGAYERIYTTGTIRPFTYYLHHGDTLIIEFDPLASGIATLRIDGLPHASARILIDDSDTIAAAPSADGIRFALRYCERIRITASSADPPPDGQAVIFAGHLAINGVNAHASASDIRIHRANGSVEDGSFSFAHEARACLIAAGIPETSITPVPASLERGGRTWSNARAFAQFANANSIGHFDVATMGVHARRTWRLYRKAMGSTEGIGIRSIHDPWCPRGRWWLRPFGWILVMKEVVAIPAPSIIDDDQAASRSVR